MFSEAAEAGAAVARLKASEGRRLARVGDRLRAMAPHTIVTCARGSSDHAATFAKYLIESSTGVPVASAAPSISSVYGVRPHLEGAVCIAVSQSGRSPDLLSSVGIAKQGGAYVVALVNDLDSPLAALADEAVDLCAGPEISVAATKSYICALAAIVGLVGEWTEDAELRHAFDAAPALLEQAWSLDWSPIVSGLRDARNLYVVGRGLGLGIAQEAALKLKETCRLHAEAFSAAEVRHGPMALVEPGFPVIVLRQDDETGASVDELVADLAARGAKLMVAGTGPAPASELRLLDAPAVLQPMLQIQSFYRAANALSLARGLDPDRPPHLAKVTETV
jgi:glucosamine--fructose-6-phosphate aminotransferase (isomerizing)